MSFETGSISTKSVTIGFDMVVKERRLSVIAESEPEKISVLLADEIVTEEDMKLLTDERSERVILCAVVSTMSGSLFFFGRVRDRAQFGAVVKKEVGRKGRRICLGEMLLCDQGFINRVYLDGPPDVTGESTESIQGLIGKINCYYLAKKVNVIWGDEIKYVIREV